MAVFSRLELIRPSIRFLVDDAIPSVKSSVRLRSGAVVDLYLHPRADFDLAFVTYSGLPERLVETFA